MPGENLIQFNCSICNFTWSSALVVF